MSRKTGDSTLPAGERVRRRTAVRALSWRPHEGDGARRIGRNVLHFFVPPRNDQRRPGRIRSTSRVRPVPGPASDWHWRSRARIPHLRAHPRSARRGQGVQPRHHSRAGAVACRRVGAGGRCGLCSIRRSSSRSPPGSKGTVAYRAEEYVAAESLDVAMRHYAPASLDQALPFLTQLAGAIDFARAAGVGHGALHLRDVFVTPEEARASGFGVVEALERVGLRAPVRRPYTRAGADRRRCVEHSGRRLLACGDRLRAADGPPSFRNRRTDRPADRRSPLEFGAGMREGAGARHGRKNRRRRYPTALAFASALEAAAQRWTCHGRGSAVRAIAAEKAIGVFITRARLSEPSRARGGPAATTVTGDAAEPSRSRPETPQPTTCWSPPRRTSTTSGRCRTTMPRTLTISIDQYDAESQIEHPSRRCSMTRWPPIADRKRTTASRRRRHPADCGTTRSRRTDPQGPVRCALQRQVAYAAPRDSEPRSYADQ